VLCRVEPRQQREGFGELSDRTITCRDCGQEFTFTAGEQAFYAERGYSEPQRCASCRAERKAQRGSSGYDSGSSYSSGGGSSYSSGGGGGYSRGGGGGGYSSGPRQMYPAVCSACGKETEVPFQPRNDKPVYCRECFQDKRASAPSYGSRY
jgi:CxxC-x17-CxxC domain-containing protein